MAEYPAIFEMVSATIAGVTTSTSTPVVGMSVYREADILLDITSTSGTGTLAVYIDSQLVGTKWINLAQFTVSTGTDIKHMHLSRSRDATVDVIVTSNAGAGTVRRIGWGDSMRVRYDISGASAGTSTMVLAVWFSGIK